MANIKICLHCGAEFQPSSYARLIKYCGEKCRRAAVAARQYMRDPERIKGHARKYKSSMQGALQNTYQAAKARGKDSFHLSPEYVRYLARTGCCVLTGIPFDPEPGSPFRPSIDRIDCDQGYVEGNVRVVCAIVNYALNTFGDDAFDRMCRARVAYLDSLNTSSEQPVLMAGDPLTIL